MWEGECGMDICYVCVWHVARSVWCVCMYACVWNVERCVWHLCVVCVKCGEVYVLCMYSVCVWEVYMVYVEASAWYRWAVCVSVPAYGGCIVSGVCESLPSLWPGFFCIAGSL